MKKFEEYQLTGYRRENGKVGVRNHVLILPVDDISNAAAEGVASLIRGTLALPQRGRVGSLNVSAAAAALLFEAVRQRGRSTASP